MVNQLLSAKISSPPTSTNKSENGDGASHSNKQNAMENTFLFCLIISLLLHTIRD